VARGRNRRRVDRSPEEAPRGEPGKALRRAAAAGGALALLAVGGLAARYLLLEGPWLRIREVRFVGASRAAVAELAALAADLEGLEAAVAHHPWIRSAQARRRLPPAVEVRLVEREPAALVDLGGLYLVDREAQVFKRASAGDGLDLPVITGFTRDDYLQRRADLEPLLLGALALLDGYAREGLATAFPVSEVHVDVDEGVTLYVGDEGTQVRLGAGDLPRKLTRLHRMLSALRAEGKQAEILYLDNRNRPSWVTVRLSGSVRSGGDGGGVRPRPSRVGGRTSPRGL
jgi:cell division protein FtsQ